MPSKPRPPEERFWARVERGADDACWLWGGGTNGRYGVFGLITARPGKRVYAHRYSYELAKGPIPDGLVINHLCSVPLCVNPNHLEVATYSENSRYGDGPAARRARQTHCKRGHPLEGANLQINANGTRHCLTCARDLAREKMRQLRAERQAAIARGDDSAVPHGTEGGYTNHGCRCEACSGAAKVASRRRRSRGRR